MKLVSASFRDERAQIECAMITAKKTDLYDITCKICASYAHMANKIELFVSLIRTMLYDDAFIPALEHIEQAIAASDDPSNPDSVRAAFAVENLNSATGHEALDTVAAAGSQMEFTCVDFATMPESNVRELLRYV